MGAVVIGVEGKLRSFKISCLQKYCLSYDCKKIFFRAAENKKWQEIIMMIDNDDNDYDDNDSINYDDYFHKND